jgi:hypothetical protein
MATCTILVTSNTDNSLTFTSTDKPGWTIFIPAANTSQIGPQLKRAVGALMDVIRVQLAIPDSGQG